MAAASAAKKAKLREGWLCFFVVYWVYLLPSLTIATVQVVLNTTYGGHPPYDGGPSSNFLWVLLPVFNWLGCLIDVIANRPDRPHMVIALLIWVFAGGVAHGLVMLRSSK